MWSQGLGAQRMKNHPTWEIVWCENVIVIEVASIYNIADLFTKTFQLHMDRMGVRCDILWT